MPARMLILSGAAIVAAAALALGLRTAFMKMFMKKAGAAVPSANRITLLRDSDGDAVLRFPYRAGETRIAAAGTRLTDLPAGERNHHWTKSLIASPDGTRLYATVGSNCNVAEHGMDEEQGRAAIWEIDRATGAKRLFATGLRNPNGMDWEPTTACCGRRSTSATSSAATLSPITWPRSATAASTAGPIPITAGMSTLG